MGFGKLLNKTLKEKKISQSDLADGIGIPRSTLNSIIQRDTSKVDIDIFLKICHFINTDPEEFYNEYISSKTRSSEISDKEHELLSVFRQLTIERQEDIITIAKGFLDSDEVFAKKKA